MESLLPSSSDPHPSRLPPGYLLARNTPDTIPARTRETTRYCLGLDWEYDVC